MHARTAAKSIGLLLLTAIVGCERFDAERATEEEEHPASERRFVQLSLDAQAAVGLQTSTAARQLVQQSLPATAWLAAKPGRQTVIKTAAVVLPVILVLSER